MKDWVNRNEEFLESHNFIATLACPLGAQAVAGAAASAKDSHSEDGEGPQGLRLVIVDGRRRSRFTHAGPLLVPPGPGTKKNEVFVYDHHPPSDEDIPALADHCLVKPLGSCTALLLHELAKKIKEKNGEVKPPYLTPDEATLCGLGIYSDTGSFGFSSTTKEDFEAAALLLTPEFGPMRLSDILDHQHKLTNVANTVTTAYGDSEGSGGSILKQLECNAVTHTVGDEKAVITHIVAPIYVNNFSALVQRFMDQENIHGAVFGLGVMEDRGRVVLVARSRSPSGKSRIDVGRICSSFGGGGHYSAASATILDLTLEEVKNRLFALVVSQVEQHGSLGEMKDLVTKAPIVAYSKQTLGEARALFGRFDLKKMPVLEGEPPSAPRSDLPSFIQPHAKLVGIIDRAVAEKAVSHGLEDVTVEEYMDMDFDTLTTDDTLFQAVELMMGKGQRLIPILGRFGDGGGGDAGDASARPLTLVGVISKADLVNLLIHQPSRFPISFLEEKEQQRRQQQGKLVGDAGNRHSTEKPAKAKAKAAQEPTQSKSKVGDGSNVRDLVKGALAAEVFSFLEKAGSIAHSMNTRVYVVGGFVRDLFLRTPNQDIDLVVEGDGLTFADKLAKATGGQVKHHHKFSSALVKLPSGICIDVATARLEYYPSPAALPCVELSSLKMDLYRRDFTINAMAIELTKGRLGTLVDYFGGINDLRQKVVRVLHSLSFVEDPTRILRAVRFEQRYGFTIEKQSLRLLRTAIDKGFFNKLSGSRAWNEFQHLLDERGECALLCLQRLRQLHLPEHVFPPWKSLYPTDQDLKLMQDVLEWYELSHLRPEPERWKCFFLTLCCHIRKPAELEALMDRFLFPESIKARFGDLRDATHKAHVALQRWIEAREAHQEGDDTAEERHNQLSDLYSIMHPIPLEGLLYMMAHKQRSEEERRHIVVYLTHLRYVTVETDGKDLIRMGLPPGPHYRTVLDALLRAKLNGQITSKEDEERLARGLIVEELKLLGKPKLGIDGKALTALGVEPGPAFTAIFRLVNEAIALGQLQDDDTQAQLQYVQTLLSRGKGVL